MGKVSQHLAASPQRQTKSLISHHRFDNRRTFPLPAA